jgi:N-(2-amino-2-carboxyethyl)-L-glutamate synthase
MCGWEGSFHVVYADKSHLGLASGGVRPGDLAGLPFDRTVDGSVGMLAVAKVCAAHVPLRSGLPAGKDEEGIVSVISVPQAFNEDELCVDFWSVLGYSSFLTCEGFNFASSIKPKAANEMMEAADRAGSPDTGVGPSRVLVRKPGRGAERDHGGQGLPVPVCADSRCNLSARLLTEALGSQVHVIAGPDATGGFPGGRIAYVRALCAPTTGTCGSTNTPIGATGRPRYRTTAPATARQFPQLDVLFAGAGTTGTLMGCARYFREWRDRGGDRK